MPQLISRQFGPIEYESDAVLQFPTGLPAFESQTQFLLIERPASAPLLFLQSVADPELCFLTLPVALIDPHYQVSLATEDLQLLGLNPAAESDLPSDVLCLAIVSAPDNGTPTANLLAPVVVNSANRRAVQAVRCDSRYSHCQPLAAPDREGTCS